MWVVGFPVLLVLLGVVGLLLVLGGGGIISVWIGAELVSLAVGMGVLALGAGGYCTKVVVLMKYLFLQMIMGALLLLLLLGVGEGGLGPEALVSGILVVILFKLGAFPGHLWVIDVYGGLSLWGGLVLGTVPKIGLLAALALFGWGAGLTLEFMSVMSVVVGGILGIGTTDVRHMLACSGVVSVGWLLVGSSGGTGGLLWLFLMYVLVLLGVVVLLEVGVYIALKLSSSSFYGGTGVGFNSGIGVLLVLGLVGMPCSVMFIFKVCTLMIYGLGAFVGVVLLASFFGAVMYLRFFTISWGSLGVVSPAWGSSRSLWGLLVLGSLAGFLVGLILLFYLVF
uniref:NADH-ubiquinone oxidoreductase chain 2 n=1 Tax=Phallusia mammillata TaxID=59560 RepID=A7WL62_9ASCI|nr:NADH dehydrogenase subunit 2 [Phallusia mammillata]CAL23075.2 NADH dehydrogenase subunit 2 [Phallusia mammillata]